MAEYKIGKIYKTTKKGKPYYRGDVWITDISGKETRKSFGRKKKYLVEKAMEEWIEKHKDLNLTFEDTASLQELFKSWMHVVKKPSISSASFEKYETTYRLRIVNTRLGTTPILNVNTTLIRNHLNKLLETNTEKTCRETLIHLKTFFRYCKSEHFIKIDPTQNLSIKLKKEPVKREAYTIEEQNKILKLLNYDDPVDLAIYLALVAGLRLGECLALEWEDLKKNTINVNKQYKKNVKINIDGTKKRNMEVSSLKTINSYREVPILDQTYQILMQHKIKQNETILSSGKYYENKNIILADEKGNYLEMKRPTRRLKKLCEDHKIEYKTYHGLRHTYITRLFENDVNPKTVQKLVGHTDIQTTLNIYTHVSQDVKKEAVEKLKDVFGV